MIETEALERGLGTFRGTKPFDHCVIDNFFQEDVARQLSEEFLAFDSEKWFCYKNPIEDKKALNDWNAFPELTYRAFTFLNSPGFVRTLSETLATELFPDQGLHGGGWHMHGPGGNLNPHLDYSIHPKLKLERRVNIIVYLSRELQPAQHGGHLGLWEHDADRCRPGELAKEIEPIFNRAVIFDTTQNSWHGMSRPLVQPQGIHRKSLAVYYLCRPSPSAASRGRALFAARPEQLGDSRVEEIIRLRSDVSSSSSVYRTS